jgi:hypothetical protein
MPLWHRITRRAKGLGGRVVDLSPRLQLGVSPRSMVRLKLERTRKLNTSQSSNLNLHLTSSNLESILPRKGRPIL